MSKFRLENREDVKSFNGLYPEGKKVISKSLGEVYIVPDYSSPPVDRKEVSSLHLMLLFKAMKIFDGKIM